MSRKSKDLSIYSNLRNTNQLNVSGKSLADNTNEKFCPIDDTETITNNNSQNGSGCESKLANTDTKLSSVKVSDIIGDFGLYQISVVIFAALRAMSCALDGLSGPFISPSIKSFNCDICNHQNANWTDGTCSVPFDDGRNYELDASQCFFTNNDQVQQVRINCKSWSFDDPSNERLMNSLTVEQSLVCDREWLKSLSNSLYFIGATFGLLFWGIISDRYGRRTAYICSHLITLIFGLSALFAQTMTTYIILRAINAFGMIGELIPRSILVEMVATRYRFVCSVICQIGWATGIILVPVLSYINPSYRFILSFPVLLTLIMSPWLIWLPESARWLIINNKYEKAKQELRRAAKINKALSDDIDLKIEQYNRQVLHEEIGSGSESASSIKTKIGVWSSIKAIFTNMHLLKDTLSVFTLLFVAEVVYFSLTLNVADLSGSLYINYIMSGLSELVSIACCGFMLAYFSRRRCLSLLLLLSTISYLLMSLVNIYEHSLPMSAILSVNAFGKLTAIGNLMVIILVSQEVFPTVIRQFGTSLCITVGKLGSAAAPFTHELGQIIGHSYCFAMFSIICFGCAFIPFGLSETGNVELPDTVGDVESNGRDNKKSKGKQSNNKNDNINSNGIIAHYKPKVDGQSQQLTNSTKELQKNTTTYLNSDENAFNQGTIKVSKQNYLDILEDGATVIKHEPFEQDLNNNSLVTFPNDGKKNDIFDQNHNHSSSVNILTGSRLKSLSTRSMDKSDESLANCGISRDIKSYKSLDKK